MCVCVGRWVAVVECGPGEGDLKPPSPVVCKSHELY